MPTFKFIFWIFFPIATIYCQSLEETLNQKLKINGMWGDYYLIDNDSSFHLVKGNVYLDSLYFLSENDIVISLRRYGGQDDGGQKEVRWKERSMYSCSTKEVSVLSGIRGTFGARP